VTETRAGAAQFTTSSALRSRAPLADRLGDRLEHQRALLVALHRQIGSASSSDAQRLLGAVLLRPIPPQASQA
jgi:hypothetical protein